MTYPPSYIATPDGIVNILQITDLHLFEDINKQVAGNACQACLERILSQALGEDIRCDLILVTGDLVSEVKTSIYDRIFDMLNKTQIPFACIAGNHDVTDELGHDLPFAQRQFIPRSPDPRLLSQYAINSEFWQVLLIDSSIPGKVGGEISEENIRWLTKQLQNSQKASIIALHHHIMPMNSKWIDQHIAKNAQALWQLSFQFPQVKTIISGHSHQEHEVNREGVIAYTTPSTCYQFKVQKDYFCYDEQANPGYRWLQLQSDGSFISWVRRLDD